MDVIGPNQRTVRLVSLKITLYVRKVNWIYELLKKKKNSEIAKWRTHLFLLSLSHLLIFFLPICIEFCLNSENEYSNSQSWVKKVGENFQCRVDTIHPADVVPEWADLSQAVQTCIGWSRMKLSLSS